MNLKPKCALVISTESIINLTQHPPTQDPTRPDSAKHSPEKHRKAVNMDLLRPKNWRTGTAYLLPLVDGFFTYWWPYKWWNYIWGFWWLFHLIPGRWHFFLYISYHPCSTTRFLYYHCKALKQYSAQLLIINCEGFTGGIQGYTAWNPTHPNISSENWWLEVGRGNFLLKYSFSGDMLFFFDKHSNHRHVESIDCTMLHAQIFDGKVFKRLNLPLPKSFHLPMALQTFTEIN